MLLISLRCFQAITSSGSAMSKVARRQSAATSSSSARSDGTACSAGTRPRCRMPDIGTPRMITSAGCRCTAGIQMQTPNTRRTYLAASGSALTPLVARKTGSSSPARADHRAVVVVDGGVGDLGQHVQHLLRLGGQQDHVVGAQGHLGDRADGGDRQGHVLARRPQPQPVPLHGRQVLAARDQHGRQTGLHQAGADAAADRSGPDDHVPSHSPDPMRAGWTRSARIDG